MDKPLSEIAKQIVAHRKQIIQLWKDIDYYEKNGTDRVDDKALVPDQRDITIGYAVNVCLTYPSWLSKAKTRLDKLPEGAEKERLQQECDIKRETLSRVKALQTYEG
jgi:hypothetical protein